MTEHDARSTMGWQRFWEHGRWWKALLAAVGYLLLYEGASLVVGAIWGERIDPDFFADATSVLLALVVPLSFGALVLTAFVASLGWFSALFGPQTVRGRPWMWLAVVLTVVPIALRLLGTDYASYAPGVVALSFVAGALIGFTEELLTRGIAVKILRDAGHGEVGVAAISSLLFALLHSVNVLTGQPPLTVVLTMAFAFGFGMMMYLVLRVTGSLIWPMVIHGLTDPTTFLAVGGIDTSTVADPSPLLTLAGPFNILFIVVALAALLLLRGRGSGQGVSDPSAPPS